ncbi:Alpha-(1-_6)-mannopyranosyltransferase A [Polaribacter huanghezhanensis]|uniref:mannosyltransferase n=1 Tax=Polaribacter huanghezhanensis TaxID=1354726 RepID=UPI002647191D|nr:mannosyltransferase [Polaribacter huanghezhanensis]WKD85806.1 Alpha-(1->6)-mannopyranosyltransferase A [Polaribacter huanghezhanensis]
MVFSRKNTGFIIAVILTIILYFLFAFYVERTQFSMVLFLYISLFATSFYILKKGKENTKLLTSLSILFRLIFLFSIPNLSQDFYRFIWDGRMLFEGLNPYLYLPENFINQHEFPVNQATELYAEMGTLNGSHFTNYPPLNQLSFYIASLFAGNSILGSVIVFRLQLILADIGIIYFGKKILEKLQLPIHNIFLYALNPFIIIELTGNIHFEPVLLFFLIWSLYLLFKHKWMWAALLLACSISVKLIPLLFLPLFYQWFVKRSLDFAGMTKLFVFYLIIFTTIILLFLPFYNSELIENYFNSVGLWFRSFEFNASFYYIFREIGYLFRGYNEIAVIGKIIPVLAIVFLGFITFFRKNKSPKELITGLLFGLSFYYFTTTTMHPWYLATLVLLSVFTKYRFPIVWSLVIIFSYQAYSNLPWKENLWFVGLEYTIVYGFLIWELFFKNHHKKQYFDAHDSHAIS